jgi:hypothetical protein
LVPGLQGRYAARQSHPLDLRVPLEILDHDLGDRRELLRPLELEIFPDRGIARQPLALRPGVRSGQLRFAS